MNSCDLRAAVYMLWGYAKHEKTWRKHKNVNIFYPEFLIGRRNSMKKCIKKHKKTWEIMNSCDLRAAVYKL